MDPSRAADITVALQAWVTGDEAAFERVAALVYPELRRIAHLHMRRENPGNTLQTTALVNEAFLRLFEGASVDWRDRAHFYAVSARLMRRILVDAARARNRDKRGGKAPHMNLDEQIDPSPKRAATFIALDDALDALAQFDTRKAQVVELRYFGGLSVEETAEVLRISPQSVMRDWKLAKAWLTNEIDRTSGAN
jgi:RNA polymerase sigma factor (TIGR02999 family)